MIPPAQRLKKKKYAVHIFTLKSHPETIFSSCLEHRSIRVETEMPFWFSRKAIMKRNIMKICDYRFTKQTVFITVFHYSLKFS
jgi:hypothetical protein